MSKTLSCLFLLYLDITFASEVNYSIRPSQSQHFGDQCSSATHIDSDVTNSQFLDNSSNYLKITQNWASPQQITVWRRS